MEIPSFSSTSWRRCWAPLADAVLLKKTAVPEWNRGSVSMFPRKSACRPLSTQSALLTPKENRMQVFCIQKKEITTVEARSMEEIYNALAERLVPTAAAATNSSFKHIVGLAGPPGAGKSTLANEVVRRINKMWPQKSSSFDSQVEPPEVATVLPMDGFHLYRQQLDAKEDPQEAHARRGAPWTFDPKRLLSCLRTLRDQGSVYAPSFDHGVGDPVEDDIFVNLQHKVVIVEGNYLLLEEGVWNEISSMFDEKWFIDIDIDKSMKRVLKRHISTGKPPHIAEQRIKYNDKPNAELIYQSKKNADLVIKSSCFRLLARCYEVSIPRLSLFGFIVTAQRCNFPSSCSFKESKVSIPLQKHQGQGQGPSGAVESAWMSSNKNYNEHESSLSLTAGVGYSRGFEYWNSRREFLSSYKLSEGDYGITEKVRMSTKGMREVAVEIVVRIRDEMSKRRVGVRVYRFTIVCLTLFIVRFFLPCVFIQKINTM